MEKNNQGMEAWKGDTTLSPVLETLGALGSPASGIHPLRSVCLKSGSQPKGREQERHAARSRSLARTVEVGCGPAVPADEMISRRKSGGRDRGKPQKEAHRREQLFPLEIFSINKSKLAHIRVVFCARVSGRTGTGGLPRPVVSYRMEQVLHQSGIVDISLPLGR